jgi:hypothetical protein
MPHRGTYLLQWRDLRRTSARRVPAGAGGRGLRHRPGKTLRVIDYIGNHRVFLTKTRVLFHLGAGDRAVAYALDQLAAGTLELPPGCSVTYDLEAIDILRSLLHPFPAGDQLRAYYEDFRERNGARPLAAEAFDDGLNPPERPAGRVRVVAGLRRGHGRPLSPEQQRVREQLGPFLERLEVTQMTKKHKPHLLAGGTRGHRQGPSAFIAPARYPPARGRAVRTLPELPPAACSRREAPSLARD